MATEFFQQSGLTSFQNAINTHGPLLQKRKISGSTPTRTTGNQTHKELYLDHLTAKNGKTKRRCLSQRLALGTSASRPWLVFQCQGKCTRANHCDMFPQLVPLAGFSAPSFVCTGSLFSKSGGNQRKWLESTMIPARESPLTLHVPTHSVDSPDLVKTYASKNIWPGKTSQAPLRRNGG